MNVPAPSRLNYSADISSDESFLANLSPLLHLRRAERLSKDHLRFSSTKRASGHISVENYRRMQCGSAGGIFFCHSMA